MSTLNIQLVHKKVEEINSKMEQKLESVLSEESQKMEALLKELIIDTGTKLKAKFPKRTIKWVHGNGAYFWVINDIVHVDFDKGLSNPFISIPGVIADERINNRLPEVIECLKVIEQLWSSMSSNAFYLALPCNIDFN